MTDGFLERFAAFIRSLWPDVSAPIADPKRRTFLLAISACAAAGLLDTVDTDKLLWQPDAKTIFLPEAPKLFGLDELHEELALYGKATDRYGNQFLTPQWITREALRVLENNLLFVNQVNREYDKSFRGARIGKSMEIRTPEKYPTVPEHIHTYQKAVVAKRTKRRTAEAVIKPEMSYDVESHHAVQFSLDVTADMVREHPHKIAQIIGDEFAEKLRESGYDKRIVAAGELPIPMAVEAAEVVTSERSGLSMRGIHHYDIQIDQTRHRFDIKIFI